MLCHHIAFFICFYDIIEVDSDTLAVNNNTVREQTKERQILIQCIVQIDSHQSERIDDADPYGSEIEEGVVAESGSYEQNQRYGQTPKVL